jgi:acyl carrier protein
MKKIAAAAVIDLMKKVGVDEKVIKKLKNDVPLLKQGVDSIDLPAILAAAEKEYNLNLSDCTADKVKTIDEFVTFINARMK